MQLTIAILKNSSGKGKGIFDFIVSVVVMVVVGTILQTGFQVGSLGSTGSMQFGGTQFGTINVFGNGAMNLMPIPAFGGSGSTSDGSRPQVGEHIDGGTQGNTHTIYEVTDTVTVDADKVKVRTLLIRPDKNPMLEPSQWTDDEGGVWKNAGQIEVEREEYFKKLQTKNIKHN